MLLAQSKSSRWSFVPAHKHGRAQALQNLLFFLGKGSTVVVILSALNRLIDMDCHPFFVFGKRRVRLLEIAEFPRFVRRTRCVGEERPEFGCFGAVLLRSEHLTRPCLRQVGAQRVSTLPAPCVALIGRSSTHMRTIASISEISSALNVSTSHCAL